MLDLPPSRQPVVAASLRTPIGRAGGGLSGVRPDDLAAAVIGALVERTGIDPETIDDVIFGCANQAGEDNRNVARMGLLLAGLPATVPGVTVNRLCASSLEALNLAARTIACGEADLIVAGGVESMSRAPWVFPKPEKGFPRGNVTAYDTTLGWRLVNPALVERYHPYSMGETAENVAARHGVGRAEQDALAARSQASWQAANDRRAWAQETVPVPVPSRKGSVGSFDTDEHPRADTTLESLARLRPAFREGGTVTAGNSSGINDGAAALLVTSRSAARALGLGPCFRVLSTAAAGVHPDVMGVGPVPATRKVLERARLRMEDVDLVEINEAFAAQVIACARDLKISEDRLNVNGGAIALGHPLGASGARIVTTLTHEMARRGAHFAVATMCVGVGQGVATLLEQVA